LRSCILRRRRSLGFSYLIRFLISLPIPAFSRFFLKRFNACAIDSSFLTRTCTNCGNPPPSPLTQNFPVEKHFCSLIPIQV
jgi:hypothetical protein